MEYLQAFRPSSGLGERSRCEHLVELATDPKASGILRNYLQNFTGRHFGFLVSPGPAITASDIVAVSCLSVSVPPEAAVSFIEDIDDELAKLTEELRGFTVLDDPANWYDHAHEMNDLLRKKDDVGSVIASKLMHAKLPELIPVWDDLTNKALGYPKGGYWPSWHRDLTANRADILDAVNVHRASVPAAAALPLLRVLDMVIWGIEESNRRIDSSIKPD